MSGFSGCVKQHQTNRTLVWFLSTHTSLDRMETITTVTASSSRAVTTGTSSGQEKHIRLALARFKTRIIPIPVTHWTSFYLMRKEISRHQIIIIDYKLESIRKHSTVMQTAVLANLWSADFYHDPWVFVLWFSCFILVRLCPLVHFCKTYFPLLTAPAVV